MLVSVSAPRRLGVPAEEARLRFGTAAALPDAGRPGPAPAPLRYLFLAGEPAFELSLWCGTCPFLFERREGANGTLSDEVPVMAELGRPVESVDDRILEPFSSLLPEGAYLPLLLDVRPELVAPGDERDYFTHEQVATWGVSSFWGLPENPRSFYYRTFETPVTPGEHLYEFVVPMVPPSCNDGDRVQAFRDLMGDGVTPTAVAVSTLDVCQPATDDASTDYYGHWGLTHFLLDGHHKMEAAARSSARVRLLALVSLDDSLAGPDDIRRLPELLARPGRSRSSA